MATMAGINTILNGEANLSYGTGDMVVTDISTGDWTVVYGVALNRKQMKKYGNSNRAT